MYIIRSKEEGDVASLISVCTDFKKLQFIVKVGKKRAPLSVIRDGGAHCLAFDRSSRAWPRVAPRLAVKAIRTAVGGWCSVCRFRDGRHGQTLAWQSQSPAKGESKEQLPVAALNARVKTEYL